MATSAPKGTARRDALLKIEAKAQAKWAAARAFEEDAPSGPHPGGKYMVTFPYPYMNGRLHIGHAFSLTKAEFSAAYARMNGKKTLFPFGFHCTGMPIQAAAVKLAKEFELYGSPLPNFPPSTPEVVEMSAELGAITIGWKAPTSTAGKTLLGCEVHVRVGADGEWTKRAEVPAAEAEAGTGQFSHTVDGLEVGNEYSFKVVSVVDGAPGVASRPLAKSADGKHPLALMPPKADKGDKGGAKKGKSAKSKVVAKTGGLTSQWDILRSMGLSAEEIVPFTQPSYWLEYFPPLGQADLNRFGLGVDWRRSFITTDVNPYYDSFVRWQFAKLRQGDFIAFGKRPSIYSEADKQPCMDHDRDKGEGVAPQEYTAIKMRLVEPLPPALASLSGREVYALAGTLRAETMCGQTNAWILPDGDYGAFEQSEKVVYLCASRAARNMSFQDLFPTWGAPKKLLEFKGRELLGAAVRSPHCTYDKIYMLPLMTISMTKGTAIVTSVPSDSPDDYAAFIELKNPKKREFYKVDAAWVDPFEPVPIITTPDLGEMSAKFMCEQLGVKSQKDTEKLKEVRGHLITHTCLISHEDTEEEAHDIVYNSGFYKGVMTAGPFVGKPVAEAKTLTRAKMVADGDAITYLEPEGLVTPRSTPDIECVVALVDQWYLKYGQEEWQARVAAHLETLECYNGAVAKAFRDALAWLSDWACSRSFGLGTRMPWDEQFLIESLSDSTIYMAYYTVAHLLQGGGLDGREVGPLGIPADKCTEAFWDAVLLGRPHDASSGVTDEKMQKLRQEFKFWYPMDCRVSGKDLIPNHLTMCLYNHAAIWDDAAMWPRSVFCNGFVQVDAEKMSKSKGNFITLIGAIETWGADATRVACADAGDTVQSANYDRVVADRTILVFTTEIDWITAALAGKAKDLPIRAEGAPAAWLDRWFENELVRLVKCAGEAYAAMRFRDALKYSFYGMMDARDRYRTGTGPTVGARASLLRQWSEWFALLMAPIAPHWSEEVWSILGNSGCAVRASWPVPTAAEDSALTAAGEYLFHVAHALNTAFASRGKKKPAKGAPPAATEKPNQVNVYVASAFPKWKEVVLELLREHFDPSTNTCADGVMRAIKDNAELASFNKGKQVAQFAAMVRDDAKERGADAFALRMAFDEAAILRDNNSFLVSTLASFAVKAVHVYAGAAEPPEPDVASSAAPGKPSCAPFHAEEIRAPPAGAPVSSAAATVTAAPAAPPSTETMLHYLAQHDVSNVLNEAVNELAIAQPDDPFEWLSQRLLSKRRQT